MLKILRERKAQSTLEYAILIGVVVAALIGMQTYIKRGYSGKLKESADQMGEQYSPGHTTYNYTTTSHSQSSEDLDQGVTTTRILDQKTDKKGSENVAGSAQEQWW